MLTLSYTLILFMGGAIDHITFATEEQCMAALHDIVELHSSPTVTPICVHGGK